MSALGQKRTSRGHRATQAGNLGNISLGTNGCHFLMAILSVLRGIPVFGGCHEEAGNRFRRHRIDRKTRFCG
jgi:hypothetical protein